MDIKVFLSRILHLFEVRRIYTKDKAVFLTFDDGPQGDITKEVLDMLKNYNAKATFFCRGDNAENNPELLHRIIAEGHSIGNHTYNHINSFKVKNKDYINDVEAANGILNAPLFRPPWGSIKLGAFLILSFKYKIIYWSLVSGDTDLERFQLSKRLDDLKFKTRPGDIVLFHSCDRHAKETRQILPRYLEWLNENNYKCELL